MTKTTEHEIRRDEQRMIANWLDKEAELKERRDWGHITFCQDARTAAHVLRQAAKAVREGTGRQA